MNRPNEEVGPRFLHFVVVILALCAGACAPGRSLPDLSAQFDSAQARIYLFRGFTGHWSHGLDTINSKLRGQGLNAEALPHDAWRDVSRSIRADKPDGKIILIGHSWGADDAIRLAWDLQRSGISVDLLVTVDPVTPPKVPANVRHAMNLFESHGIRDILPWWRGVPIERERDSRGVIRNIDLRHDRPDLCAAGVTHATITDSPGVQNEIVRAIVQELQSPPPRQ